MSCTITVLQSDSTLKNPLCFTNLRLHSLKFLGTTSKFTLYEVSPFSEFCLYEIIIVLKTCQTTFLHLAMNIQDSSMSLCILIRGFPGGSYGKESACNVRDLVQIFKVRKRPWRRKWQPTPAELPAEFHGLRNLAGYSPWVLIAQSF